MLCSHRKTRPKSGSDSRAQACAGMLIRQDSMLLMRTRLIYNDPRDSFLFLEPADPVSAPSALLDHAFARKARVRVQNLVMSRPNVQLRNLTSVKAVSDPSEARCGSWADQ